MAGQKSIQLKIVSSRATAIQPGDTPAILTQRGDAIAVDTIILATGNEVKPILPHLKSDHIIQDPWAPDALKECATWPSPVLLIGTGLTAVDMVLCLRRNDYTGEIVATSRNGLLPQPHATPGSIATITADEIAAQQSLPQLQHWLRKKIATTGEWRPVIDALRPHTQLAWQRFTARDKQRFLKRLSTFWNIHRHRMAPEIAARTASEIAAGTLRIVAEKNLKISQHEGALSATFHARTIAPSRIINCTGPEMNLARSGNMLLKQLLANNIVEAHATNIGIAADKYYRAWGALHPHLFVIGSLLTGQLLESTAVPELRTQAAHVATTCLYGPAL